VQSQTTFAVLGKGEEGEFEVRVLKQKIWVEGVSYELQVCTAFVIACGGQVCTRHRGCQSRRYGTVSMLVCDVPFRRLL
jgi:hypothetical protein